LQHLGDSCKVLEEIASGKHPFAKVNDEEQDIFSISFSSVL